MIEVLIRGAGPVGCAAALALRRSRNVKILADTQAPGFRPIALSYGSRLILERLGIWSALEATPLETILVSQRGGFGRMRMDAADAGVPALGYVTSYPRLLDALRDAARDLLVADEPPARLVVHAEGISADMREKRYQQHALVGLVEFDPPARATAFERFTDEGPLALLPFAGRYALIWGMRPERAAALAAAPQAEFLDSLAKAAGARPGRPVGAEALAVQPLVARVRGTRVGERCVYIGNAAQTLHPVAGQGLNLGLRDAWDLAQTLAGAADPGDAALLARFAARRRLDSAAAVRVTDALASAFLSADRLTRAARGAALTALDLFPAPRRFFARRMMFGPSALP